MADAAAPAGSLSAANRLPREAADKVLIACAVGLAADVMGGVECDRLLDLMARALPMAGQSTRIAALREPCANLLAAAPLRHRRDGAMSWCVANLTLQRAVVKDALDQALGALR